MHFDAATCFITILAHITIINFIFHILLSNVQCMTLTLLPRPNLPFEPLNCVVVFWQGMGALNQVVIH